MSFRIEEHNEVSQVTTYQDTSLGIMRWGKSNSYPKTLENLIKQSPSAYPAVKRTSKFYKGSGFEGEDEIVNQSGLTLGGAVSIIADDYALFGAFAIQCNYNIKGEVTSINPLRISDLRFSEFDELNYANKIGYFFDFGRNSEVKKSITQTATKNKIKWFNRFNPKASLSQIEATEDGINNYLGQVLYYSDEGFNSYPTPPLQPAINFVLSDIENSILVRKETSTGFINSYLYKTTLSSTDPIHLATMGALEEAQGARGIGKITAITGLAPEDLTNTLLEPIDGGASDSIINSAKTTYELNREVINGTYLIPPALAGIDQKSGFSGADLEEAYSVYNAITQNPRDTIESEINKILKVSTFDVKKIKINKLELGIVSLNEPLKTQ